LGIRRGEFQTEFEVFVHVQRFRFVSPDWRTDAAIARCVPNMSGLRTLES
jgi:hypothetical protein